MIYRTEVTGEQRKLERCQRTIQYTRSLTYKFLLADPGRGIEIKVACFQAKEHVRIYKAVILIACQRKCTQRSGIVTKAVLNSGDSSVYIKLQLGSEISLHSCLKVVSLDGIVHQSPFNGIQRVEMMVV